MMIRHFFALAVFGLSTFGIAQDSRRVPGQEKIAASAQAVQEFRNLVKPAKAVASDVRKLRKKLKWHKSLGDATREAKKTNKPILWIQALGKLRGYT